MTKREEELQKLMRVYDCSREEAESIYEYDHYYCDSDEHAMQYLKEHFGMSDKEVSDYFYKSSPSALAGTAPAPKRTKEQTNQLRAAQTSRVEYIAHHLTTYYSFLFGAHALICGGNKVSFKCPDGATVEVTVSKHKEQKVVTADPKRPRKGSSEAPQLTDRELRVMALENCLREEEKLFPHLSVHGAAFGFVIGDPKYPFGSVRLVHKSSKKIAGNA